MGIEADFVIEILLDGRKYVGTAPSMKLLKHRGIGIAKIEGENGHWQRSVNATLEMTLDWITILNTSVDIVLIL